MGSDGRVTIRAVVAASGVRCPVSGAPSDRVLQSVCRQPIIVAPLTRPS
jgi:hypothetical protein